jgi:hypothetical protein
MPSVATPYVYDLKMSASGKFLAALPLDQSIISFKTD